MSRRLRCARSSPVAAWSPRWSIAFPAILAAFRLLPLLRWRVLVPASACSARRRRAIAGVGASGCARLHPSSFVLNALEHRTANIEVPRFMLNLSASASRRASGSSTVTQSRKRPDRYSEPSSFETMPHGRAYGWDDRAIKPTMPILNAYLYRSSLNWASRSHCSAMRSRASRSSFSNVRRANSRHFGALAVFMSCRHWAPARQASGCL